MMDKGKLSFARRVANVTLAVVIGFIFLAIFTYTSQVAFSHAPSPLSVTRTPSPASFAQPSVTAQSTAILDASDYRTILLLERAADLMVAYVEKVNSGEINPQDASTRQLYTLAFPVAVEGYNQTAPYLGMESMWNNVIRVTTAYNAVYSALQQGRQISANDLFHMQSYRQFYINYQTQLEILLANQGVDQIYFTRAHQQVDQILLEAYGSTPPPVLVP